MFDNLNAAFSRHREYIRVRDELSALEDHDLADLGICRCDIESIAQKSALAVWPTPDVASQGVLDRIMAYAGRLAI